MLPLRPTAGNWIKFLLLLALVLLVAIVVQGDRSAKDQTQINNLEKEKKEWIERDTKQDKRLKKLEQGVKKLKTSKVNSPKTNPPKQVAVAYPVGCERYKLLLSKYPWDVVTAARIIEAESGCNPLKHNWTDTHRDNYGNIICLGSWGLFNIGCVHGYSRVYLENPANNVAVAYKIYQTEGWNPWTTY